MEKTKKPRILIEPNDNSIAYTAYQVLKDDFDIVIKDYNAILLCSDDLISYDKGDTEYIFSNRDYYPNPEKNTICIKKPIDGSGSKNITFEIYKKNNDDFVYQKYINGKEYTVDCWYHNCELKNFAVRERGRIWNGISMQSKFTNEFDDEIKKILDDIIKEFTGFDKEEGIMAVQFIRDKDGKFWLIEINPRPCTNMCYGGDNNFILNFMRASCGMEYKNEKITCKEINRFIGWEIIE